MKHSLHTFLTCLVKEKSESNQTPKIWVATGQGKVREIQGQGKVREFCSGSGNFGILKKVREI